MWTDTALALGLLALLATSRIGCGSSCLPSPSSTIWRPWVVTSVVYSNGLDANHLGIAGVLLAVLLVASVRRVQRRWVYVGLGLAIWASFLASGVDPIVTRLAIGLSAPAYSPAREELEQATVRVRLFREQPASELAGSATATISSTLSPNERLQTFFHPWSSCPIVPLFALANAGIRLNGSFLRTAYTTPITLGVLIGYVVGKPVALMLTSAVTTRLSNGRIRAPIGWAALLGTGNIAGIGFTVAILIADRACTGAELADAKLGALR